MRPLRLKTLRKPLHKSLHKSFRKSLRKSFRKPFYKENPIHTTGSAKSIVIHNGTPHTGSIQWDIGYDGTTATGIMDVQNQDRVARYNVNLDTGALGQLLSTPTVAIPIDQRLRETFSSPNGVNDSVNNRVSGVSSFTDYVQPVGFRIGDSSSQSGRSLRKKYRVTPYPHNGTNRLRKRKLEKKTLTRINQ